MMPDGYANGDVVERKKVRRNCIYFIICCAN